MDPSTLLIGLAVAAGGAGLLVRHVLSWRALQRQPLEEDERQFRRRQLRRRMQASAMIGLAGAGLACEPLVARAGSPWLLTIYTLLLIAVLIWIVVLAAADALATRVHYGRQRDELVVQKVVLEAELRRRRSKATGNGRAGKKPR